MCDGSERAFDNTVVQPCAYCMWIGICTMISQNWGVPGIERYSRLTTNPSGVNLQDSDLARCQLTKTLARWTFAHSCRYSRSKARILSRPIWSMPAWIASRANWIVLFPKLTVTTIGDDSGKTPRDSYHAGPLYIMLSSVGCLCVIQAQWRTT